MIINLTECPQMHPADGEPRADIVVCGEVENLYQLGILAGRMMAAVKAYYDRKRKEMEHEQTNRLPLAPKARGND